MDLHPHYVYVVRDLTTKHLKIGHSKNPIARLNVLQSSCPHPLEALHIWRLKSSPYARGMEQRLHALFDWTRLHGEWFDVSFTAVWEVGEHLRLKQSREAIARAAKCRERDGELEWDRTRTPAHMRTQQRAVSRARLVPFTP